jgi:TPR repeat protein
MVEDWLESQLYEVKQLIECGDLQKAKVILQPLITQKVPEAIFLASQFSLVGEESVDEFENRSVKMLVEASKLGYAPATYSLAVCYDLGDMVDQNSEHAALLFKKAAEEGHLKAKLSYGLDLFYGSNGIVQNKTLGLSLIKQAAEEGVEGANEELIDLQKRVND